MTRPDVPVLSAVLDAGADDRVFDSLLFLGPFVVAAVAVLGRSRLTTGLAVGYLGVLVGYVLYRGVQST